MKAIRRSGHTFARYALTVALTLLVGHARAQDREVEAAIGTRTVVRRGPLTTMGRQMVPLAGRGQAPASEVAAVAFKEHNVLATELRRARAGLLADPVVEDEVVETDSATILSSTTRAVIVDADAVRRSSPELARFRSGKQRAKLAELDAKTRKAFDEFFARAKGFAANHPMRVAADQSEQALLDAVVAGKGDMVVTTTITIPKHGRKRDSKGALQAPTRATDGSLAFNKGPVSMTAASMPSANTGLAIQPGAFSSPVEENTEGKKTYTAKFLTGFTEGDEWEWSRRWDFPTGGYFRVKASAWYDYGLRVPMEVTATLDPTSIHMTGADADSEYEVQLKANALDGSKSFYEATGISSSEVHDGNELVLDAGLKVTFTLHVLGTDINESLPKNDAFDFSQDFKPPFGDCGTSCGFNVWIPAEITHTSVNILGIIKGSARAGVNVGGNGTVHVDFEALSGDRVSSSWGKGDKKNAKNKHTLDFTKGGVSQTMVGIAPELGDESSREFGYRLSSPRYDWGIVLTPGVRADVDIHLWPIKETFSVQPLWLDVLAIKLGTLKLGAHAGSKATYALKHGRKSKPLQPTLVNAPIQGGTNAAGAKPAKKVVLAP